MSSTREIRPTGKEGAAPDATEQNASAAVSQDPRAAKWDAIVKVATRWNAAHPELVAEFNKLTGGKCAGNNAGVSVRAVRRWQMDHGLKPDGKIGKATVEAARAETPDGKEDGAGEQVQPSGASEGSPTANQSPKKVQTISFGDDEGSTVEGGDVPVGSEPTENPNLMDSITAGATGHEKREGARTSETLEKAGSAVTDAGEGMHAAGFEEQPWMKAAMAPAIVEMLREGDYIGAAKTMALTFSPGEWAEGLTFACEKLGLHAGVKVFKHLVAVGTELNVTLELVLWTYEGLHAISEAHEKGDRDSRISIYASAFADGFLYGENAPRNAGAVTEEQREAAERGRKDGIATAGRTGDLAPAIGKQLLKHYGGEKNARQAIIDALLSKAGMTGIKTHEGT